MAAEYVYPDPTHFPLYLARHERLRRVMREVGVPCVVTIDPVNILYATGAQNMTVWTSRNGARYLLVLADGPTILYDFFGCRHLARGLPTIDEIRPALGLSYFTSGNKVAEAAEAFAAEIDGVVRDHLGGACELGVDRFPFQALDALRARGYRLRDADDVFMPARKIKQPIELPLVRESLRRVEDAVGEMEAAIEPGRTESEIWSEFQRRFVALEGQYIATRLLQSGPRTFPYFQECAGRPVREGELVCLDTDALGFEGYAVDFSRTFLCGSKAATPEQKRLYGRAREQLEWNIALIGPGIAFEDIANRAWVVPEEHQQSRYYCVGHGLGMSGEYPNIPHVVPGQPYPLPGAVEPGMIICVESYVGAAAAGQGVKLEEELLVTETGVERLSSYPFDERLGK
jgi:Xaa-Pro aminopeptidase